MKLGLIIGGVIVAVLIGVWAFLPSNECQGAECNAEPIAKQAVTQTEQGQAYLYDVRSPEEYNAGHAQAAVNFDVELLKAGQLPDAPKDSAVYVYCRSGNRSAEAKGILLANGYTNVTDLGGLDNMRAAGVL